MSTDVDQLYCDRSKFLREITDRLGPRNPSYELGAIKFHRDCRAPCPYFHSGNVVDVYLSRGARDFQEAARWELAHECVHRVDPRPICPYGRTNVLEEGIATWWQYRIRRPKKGETSFDPAYARAESLVAPHVDRLLPAVRQIRSRQKVTIGDIEFAALEAYCPGMPHKVLNELIKTFDEIYETQCRANLDTL